MAASSQTSSPCVSIQRPPIPWGPSINLIIAAETGARRERTSDLAGDGAIFRRASRDGGIAGTAAAQQRTGPSLARGRRLRALRRLGRRAAAHAHQRDGVELGLLGGIFRLALAH